MEAQQLVEKLEQLKKERESLIQEANARLSFLGGQIALVEELLKPTAPEKSE